MIGAFIEQWGTLGIKGVLIILAAWLIWYLVTNLVGFAKKCVDKFIDKMDKQLERIEDTSVENKELNKEIAEIQKETHKDIDACRIEHKAGNKEIKANQKVISGILKNLLEVSNGSNPAIKKLIILAEANEAKITELEKDASK